MAKRKNRRQPPASAPSFPGQATRRISNDVVWAVSVVATITLSVCAVYGRGLHAPFIFDDDNSVINNSSIRSLWPLVGDADFPGPLNPPMQLCTAGRPLVNLSLAVNYHFGQLNPTGYHAFNIVVHILSALLVWLIVVRTLQLNFFSDKFAHAARPLALLVALIWALHPLQTEAVEYITQRTELMVGFCYLATLYTSLRYWAATSPVGRSTWLVLAALACLAGASCKEVMVSAPVVVLLFERTFITGSFRRAVIASWPLYLGLSLSWALLAVLNSHGPRSESAGFHLDVPAYAWWFTQAKVFVLYLKLCVWPFPLVIHYEIPYLRTIADAWPWVLPIALLALLTLWLLWRRLAAGFALAWVFAVLLPTLVVPIITEVAAERRMYLPLAALVTLMVVGAYQLARRASARGAVPTGDPTLSVALIFAALVASVCSVATARRLSVYNIPISLWQDAVARQPEDPVVRNNLGMVLVGAGRPREASPHLEAAVRFDPGSPHSQSRLAFALIGAGRAQEALPHLEEAMRIKPDDSGTLDNLGFALIALGRPQDALGPIERALELEPDSAEAHNNLGIALTNIGRPQEALPHFEQTLRLKPDNVAAATSLGIALLKCGRPREAVEQLERAIRLDPERLDAFAPLASAYVELGRAADGIASTERALKLARKLGQTGQANQFAAWLMNQRGGASRP
jgi:tetratricopeptide (TPR) repeat protein